MRSRHWVVMVALVLALGALGPAAFADTNLLANGSFETGDFTDWTLAGNTGFTGVCDGCEGYTAEDGDFFAYMGAVGSDALISQPFSDVSGDSYVFSFWYNNNNGGTPEDFSAYWDGTQLLSIIDSPNTDGWVNYTFTETGTGTDTVQFDARNDPSYDALDNASVTGVSPIPEPSSFLLMGSGLLGLAGAVRRKFRN
jgi:hypothetical protein